MPAMEFRVLGPLEVIGPRGPIKIGSGLQRAILALLVLHVGETISTDHLIDEVWGDDPPPSAQHAIGVHVSRLRRALGVDCIESQPPGYRLRAEGSVIDVGRFEALMAEASQALSVGDPQAAADALAVGSTSFGPWPSNGGSMPSSPAVVIWSSCPTFAGSSAKCHCARYSTLA